MASAKYEILLQLATQQAEAASRQSADKIAKSFDNAWRRFASFEAFKLGLRTVENAHRRLTEGMEKNSVQMQRQADVVTSAFDRLLAAAGDLVGKNSGFTNYNQGIAAYLNSLTEWARSEDGAKSIESWFNLLKQAAMGLAITLDSFVLPTMIAMVKVFGEAPPIEEIMPDGSVRVIQSRGAQIVESLEKVQAALANARASAGQAFRGENVNFAPGATDVPLPPNYKYNREKELKELQDSISKGEAQIDAAMARMDKMVSRMFASAIDAEKAEMEKADSATKGMQSILQLQAEKQEREYAMRLEGINKNLSADQQELAARQMMRDALKALDELDLADREDYIQRRNEILDRGGKQLTQIRDTQAQKDAATLAAREQMAAQITSSMSSNLSTAIAQIAAGEKTAGEAFKDAVGGIVQTMGTMLIQMGTAAVLAGTIGTVIPIFAPATGGPAAVGAGLAAIAGGALMVGVGAAMSGSSAATKAGAPPPSRGNVSLSDRWQSTGSPGLGSLKEGSLSQPLPPAQTLIVNFPTGFVIGSKEQVAAGIRLAMQANQPGAVGWVG